MNPAMPPRWAEFALRLHLAPRYRQTVSGDLLEEYRERIHPERGQRRAEYLVHRSGRRIHLA